MSLLTDGLSRRFSLLRDEPLHRHGHDVLHQHQCRTADTACRWTSLSKTTDQSRPQGNHLIYSVMTETTVLDFKISNTFDEYRDWMNAPEQQAMFAEMGVQTFYIGVCKGDSTRATVMFQGPENVLYDIFTNPETKPVVEASGHVYDGTVITRWLA